MNLGPKIRYILFVKTGDGSESFNSGDELWAYCPSGAVTAWLAANPHISAPVLDVTVARFGEFSPRLYHFHLEHQPTYSVTAGN